MAAKEDSPEFDWQVVVATVRGATHVRRGAPNQDAVQHKEEAPVTVMAVSDGHGSAKCFRSDQGAKLAVDVGVTETLEFLRQETANTDLSRIKRSLEEQLPRRLVQAWRELVERDLEERPLLARETGAVAESQGVAARDTVERTPVIVYGATLLVIAVHPKFVAALQLGDGDILQVDASGKVDRIIEEDRRLLANETTSLSAEHAWRDFRFTFMPLVDRPPSLLLAATDGYSNSFNTEADFLQVGTDLLNLLRNRGVDHVQANLGAWLQAASEQGSGDDVTVGLLYCPAAFDCDGPDDTSRGAERASMDTSDH